MHSVDYGWLGLAWSREHTWMLHPHGYVVSTGPSKFRSALRGSRSRNLISAFPSLADASELDAHSENGITGAPWPGKAFHVGCFMIRRQWLCKWWKKRSSDYTSRAEDVAGKGALLPRTPPTSTGWRRGWGSGAATSVFSREKELSVSGHCGCRA